MNKRITQFRWLAATLLLVAAMVMPSLALAEGYDENGFGSESDPYQPATPTTDKYDINGDGTKDEVFEIGNAGQLYWFADKVNNENATYGLANAVLTADITVNNNVLKADGSIADDVSGFRSWTPMGYYKSMKDWTYYAGIFDGDNHTISGLYFNDSKVESVGLFGRVLYGGCIKNVGVVDSYFNGNDYVSGVCGFSALSTIENCYNKGTVFSMGFAGGICGDVENGAISNCYNSGSVTGEWYVGGVCGSVNSLSALGNDKSCIINCYNTGDVKGVNGVQCTGGVCGLFVNSICSNCYNTGTVSAPAENIGAVFGDASDSKFTNCYYLEGCNAEGTSFTNTLGTSMTQDRFGSGEVCYLLSQGSTVDETFYDGSVWGQQLGVDNYPVASDYKVIRTARGDMDANGNYPYWATFSNQTSDAYLGDLTIYKAKVNDGKMTLTECDNTVAKGEGVLVKGSSEYLNAKLLNTATEVTEPDNDLVATPATAQIVTADDDYTLYRLTYNDVNNKEAIGFYLSLVKDENGDVVQSSIGKQLKATPGKAYLNVLTSESTSPTSAAPARGFAFPGNAEITGIECITVTDESLHRNSYAEDIFDLQGRKVINPTKGLYIKNGKKVIIK